MRRDTRFGWKSLLAGIAALASLAGIAPASALDLAGKRVTLIIPYQEGSGSTIHGRLYALALERALPGKPTIIVRNIDGGGSVRGINQFYKDARPDGMMIAAIGTGTFFQYILKDSAVAYPLPEFRPFVTSPFGLLAYARTDLGLGKDYVENVRKLIAKPPVYGGSGPTSSDLPALLSFDLLGIRQKNVFGLSNAGIPRRLRARRVLAEVRQRRLLGGRGQAAGGRGHRDAALHLRPRGRRQDRPRPDFAGRADLPRAL